jgi:hypothetical protein
VRAAMQYQHPELELVRAALNQGGVTAFQELLRCTKNLISSEETLQLAITHGRLNAD